MKLFKKRNIQALIYGLFMLLPFCAILARVIYVQSNKNAYESYYGETINQSENVNINIDELEYGYNYLIESNAVTPNNESYIVDYSVENIVLNGTSYNHHNIRFYVSGYNGFICQFWDSNETTFNWNMTTNPTTITFTYFSRTNDNFSQYLNNILYKVEYNQYSFLDNAFEYSLDRFVDENNFGNFDFFQWFSTFFLQDNAVNNLYVHFINWYMNYMLYVSLGYLIFSILMWFVNFFRSLVEKSTDLNL